MLRRLAVALPILAALVAVSLVLPALGTPSGDALGSSLAREVEGDNPSEGCKRLHDAVWTCLLVTEGGSSSHQWWLRVDGRCWTGSLSDDLSPPLTRGCVGLRDQLFGF